MAQNEERDVITLTGDAREVVEDLEGDEEDWEGEDGEGKNRKGEEEDGQEVGNFGK